MAMKTTIWRPNVRVTLDEYGEVEDTESGGEEVTKQGTKRKRAPPTKGPCEHGVKYRSNCKVCSACPHGKQRSRCKECGGSQSASTVVSALQCKECGGSGICALSTVVSARSHALCKECGGSQSASTVVSARSARSAVGLKSASTVVSARVQGVRWCISLRARSKALSALALQGVRWVSNLRARSSALSVQGVRWVSNQHGRRARSQGVRWGSASTVVRST